ncbi:bacterial Ig-like domain-containing protein [Xylocopilactobacillus apicola]|uniref:Uncharacterized protein n=1 Tax=Xylocopilactobacillus apicola TaxID=2932184 RepID=A0AAU9DFI0_9LACO|nr:bacterial Ig-like domain-containing protein [Xylocopilactobacillus apicola]BDR59702.1 hypothetical protein XA3_21430 [Xylocopilactobacillus apicola]
MNFIRNNGKVKNIWLLAAMFTGVGLGANSVNADVKPAFSSDAGLIKPSISTKGNDINPRVSMPLGISGENVQKYFNIYGYQNGNSATWESDGTLTLTPDATSVKDNKNLTGTAYLGFAVNANSRFSLSATVNLGNKTAGDNGGEGIGFVFYPDYDNMNPSKPGNNPGTNEPGINYPGNSVSDPSSPGGWDPNKVVIPSGSYPIGRQQMGAGGPSLGVLADKNGPGYAYGFKLDTRYTEAGTYEKTNSSDPNYPQNSKLTYGADPAKFNSSDGKQSFGGYFYTKPAFGPDGQTTELRTLSSKADDFPIYSRKPSTKISEPNNNQLTRIKLDYNMGTLSVTYSDLNGSIIGMWETDIYNMDSYQNSAAKSDFLKFAITGSTSNSSNLQQIKFESLNYSAGGVITAKFVDDDTQQDIMPPILSNAQEARTVPLIGATQRVSEIEHQGNYYLTKVANTTYGAVTLGDGNYDTIYGIGSDDTVTYSFKRNEAKLVAKNVSIEQGDSWAPKDNFVSASDHEGNTVNFDKVTNTNNVDVNKPGTYQVTYSYTPKRLGPISNVATFSSAGPKNLRTVTATGKVIVAPAKVIKLNYVDQDGQTIADSYLSGIPNIMKKGEHQGKKGTQFTLNPVSKLSDGYEFVQAEKAGDTSHTPLTSNTLTFGDDAQEINLVYKSIATIKFVNDDDQGANLHDPLTQDSGNKDQVVELKDTKTIVDGIEGKDRYLGKIESGVTVTSAKDTNDKITSDGQPQVITYHFKNNQAKLTGKDITIAKGSTWDPASTLDKGIDYDGTEFNYSERTVNYTGTVDTSTVGEYTVTYKYTPKRPIPGANDSKELPEVTTTANVTVVDKQPITLEYVDQDGNKIDTKYLAGLSQDMASGDHVGSYGSEFKLEPSKTLTKDGNVSYKFVKAEKDETEILSGDYQKPYQLTFNETAQTIKLVYKNVLTIKFVDEEGNKLNDPLSQDGVPSGQAVELDNTQSIIGRIELTGKYYLDKAESDSGAKVTFAEDSKDKIQSNGKPQIITYQFKKSQAALKGKDVTIQKGESWTPAASFDKGTDYNGSNLTVDKVTCTGTVDASKDGEYTVTYEYTPKRPIPGTSAFKDLPKVTATAKVIVTPKEAITIRYVDQAGNVIDSKYLDGISPEMASGAHFGPYQSTFTLNPQANLTFDKDVYYQFVQAEKTGDSTHTKLPSNTLTFGNAAQSIDLVYKKAKSTITIHFIDAGKGKELAKDVKTEEIGSTPLDLSETSSYIKSKIPDGYVYAKDSEIAGNGLKQTPEVKFLAKAQDVNVYLLGKPVRFKILHRIYMNPSKDVKGLRDLDMEVRTGYQYDFSLNNKDHAAPRGYTLIPGQESKTNGTVERDTVVILYYSRIR